MPRHYRLDFCDELGMFLDTRDHHRLIVAEKWLTEFPLETIFLETLDPEILEALVQIPTLHQILLVNPLLYEGVVACVPQRIKVITERNYSGDRLSLCCILSSTEKVEKLMVYEQRRPTEGVLGLLPRLKNCDFMVTVPAVCFLDPRLKAELERHRSLVALDVNLPPDIEQRFYRDAVLGNTSIILSDTFFWITWRNRRLNLLVASFSSRLSCRIAPSLFLLCAELPVYIVLEIALWEAALQMVEERPYCYSAAKHRERLEEEINQKRCVEIIQSLRPYRTCSI